MAPVPFHEALKRERLKAGRTVHDVARGISVPQERFRAFEMGEAVPTRAEWGRLCLQLRSMRFFPPAATADGGGVAQLESPPRVEPLPLPRRSPTPKTFGEALRNERELEKVAGAVVADLLGVSVSAVYAWEQDKAVPPPVTVEKLIQIFPRLDAAPKLAHLPSKGIFPRGRVAGPIATLGDVPSVRERLASAAAEGEKSVIIEGEEAREALDALTRNERRALRHPDAMARYGAAIRRVPTSAGGFVADETHSVKPAAEPSPVSLIDRIVEAAEALWGGRWQVLVTHAGTQHWEATARLSETTAAQQGSQRQVHSDRQAGESSRSALRSVYGQIVREAERESASLRQQAEETAAELRARADRLAKLTRSGG